MDEIPVNNYQCEQLIIQPNVVVAAGLSKSQLTQINTLFEQGKAFMAEKNYQQAISQFDQGIEQLGHYYLSDQIMDDTDMKLMLANVEEKKGNLEPATHLKHNVLESRIQMYCQLSSKPKESINYIGEAWMEENQDIIVQLFANEAGTSGQSLTRYQVNHPKYNEILSHLGDLKPGERKGVLPWAEKE